MLAFNTHLLLSGWGVHIKRNELGQLSKAGCFKDEAASKKVMNKAANPPFLLNK